MILRKSELFSASLPNLAKLSRLLNKQLYSGGKQMTTIQTERLLIRDHIFSDLPGFHQLLSNTAAMIYLPGLQSDCIEESQSKLKDAIQEAASYQRESISLLFLIRKAKLTLEK
jgi:hypothetical protein